MNRFDQEVWICDTQESICAFGGGGSSQPSGQTTTVQKSDPWSGQQPYLSDFFQQAQNFYQGGNTGFNPQNAPQFYQGSNNPGPQSTVAQFTPAQLQAQGLEQQQGLSNLGPGSVASAANTANAGILNANPANNPAFQQMSQNVLSQVVPGLESTFNQGNSLNNPGAAFAVSQGATSALGNLAYQDYTNQQANQLKALALAPTTQGMNYQNIGAIQDSGAQQQALNQQNLQGAINQWNYQQQLPLQMLDQYGNAIQGGYGSTSTLTEPYYSASNGANILGGAIGGGLLGSQLSGGSPYGAAGGAGLGALAMLGLG